MEFQCKGKQNDEKEYQESSDRRFSEKYEHKAKLNLLLLRRWYV